MDISFKISSKLSSDDIDVTEAVSSSIPTSVFFSNAGKALLMGF